MIINYLKKKTIFQISSLAGIEVLCTNMFPPYAVSANNLSFHLIKMFDFPAIFSLHVLKRNNAALQ